MNRLLSTIRWDVQLQLRYGFYYAGLFVVIVIIVLVSQLPTSSLDLLFPPFLIFNMVTTTFYFVAGLVLLEKRQQTLEGLVVTPLRQGEYLAAKVVSLTILVIMESGLIVGFGYGLGLNWLWLLPGLVLMAAIYTLTGFAFVSRYESINEYLLPSVIPMIVLSLPLIDYFGWWESPIFYLIPTQGPLVMIQAAFQPVGAWEMGLAVLTSVGWVGVGYWWSRKTFERFITQRAG
jgi:fluoroquinolone transport system permease protein